MYRTAIVGCGPRAARHAEAYAHVASGRIVACCDLDEGRLRDFGERFGIEERSTDLMALLDAVQPDLVHLVTMPRVRWPVIEVILRHRPRGILIEKPLNNRPEEGYRILDAGAQSGVAVFVNHQLRHHASWQRVRALLQEEAVGSIQSVRASCRGNLLEQGTHLFDLIDFLWGDTAPLTGSAGEAGTPWVVAQTTGANGFAGQHTAPSYTAGVLAVVPDWHIGFECGPDAPAWPGEENYWLDFGIEIYGRDGRIGCSLNRGWWLHTGVRDDEEDFLYGSEDQFAQGRLIETILQSLDDPGRHPNNAERSKVSFDLVMAAQRAAWCRTRVRPGAPVQDADIDELRVALERGEGGV